MRKPTLHRLLVLLVVVLRIIGVPAQAAPQAHAEHESDSPAVTAQREHCHEHSGDADNTTAAPEHHSPNTPDSTNDSSQTACCEGGECACACLHVAFGATTPSLALGSQHTVASAFVAPYSGPPSLILRPPA